MSYANNLGAEWAVLSNGRSWQIYNAHLAKPLNQKLIFHISDIFSQVEAARTLSLLSRVSMQNNRLSEAWTEQHVTALITDQLTTQGSDIRRLLRRLCSEQTNTAVSEKTIGRVLESLLSASKSPSKPSSHPVTEIVTSTNDVNDKRNGAVKIENYDAPDTRGLRFSSQKNERKQYTLAQLNENPELAIGLRPISIHFNDGGYLSTKDWAELAVHLVEWLNRTHGFQAIPFKVTEHGKNYFINDTPYQSGGKKMINPRALQVSGNIVYMETCQNTPEKLKNLLTLVRSSGVDPETVIVTLP